MIVIYILGLVAGIALLFVIIGGVTVAVTIGFGPFVGAGILILLLLNAWVWGRE